MKQLLTLSLPALATLLAVGTSSATELDGKWGLGVNMGNLFSSAAEASILRGISNRTAWLLDVSASQSRDKRGVIDKSYITVVGISRFERLTIVLGPRVRRFTRPESSLSPYLDVYAHFVDGYQIQSSVDQSQSSRQVGGEAGFAIGVEYFSTRWPFSVSAHTNVARLAVSHVSDTSSSGPIFGGGLFSSRVSSGTVFSNVIALSPSLQVRVYF